MSPDTEAFCIVLMLVCDVRFVMLMLGMMFPLELSQALNPCLWHGSALLHLPAAQILGLPGALSPGPLGVTSQYPLYC